VTNAATTSTQNPLGGPRAGVPQLDASVLTSGSEDGSVPHPNIVKAFATFALLPTFAAAQSSTAGAEESPPKPASRLFTFPKRVHLTFEQELELRALQEEYTPKLAEVQKAIDAIMTAERKAARAEARRKAIAEGKTDAEVTKAGRAAVPLSREEKRKYNDALAAKEKLLGEVRRKRLGLLTEEQKARLYQGPKTDR
jgi:hypothetical protein